MDDKKISRVKIEFCEDIVAKFSEHFGGLSIQRGKKFIFLGMDVEMTNDGKVKIGMQEYINEEIEMFDEDISTPVASASCGNLTEIQEK